MQETNKRSKQTYHAVEVPREQWQEIIVLCKYMKVLVIGHTNAIMIDIQGDFFHWYPP